MSEINSVPLSIREESFPNRRSSVFHNKPRNSSDTVTIRLSKSETDLAENERRLNCSVNTNVVSIMRSEDIDEENIGNIMTTSASFHQKLASPDYVTVPIVGYEVMEERERFTVYKLRIENSLTKDCWLVLRRYTDFVRLNNKLKSHYPQLTMVQLPKKKIFGDNFSNDFLENRKHGLQIFINSILNNPTLKYSEIVREFFCLDEPPTYSDNMEECKSIFEAQEETINHLKYELESRNNTIINLKLKMVAEMKAKNKLILLLNKIKSECPNYTNEIDEIMSNNN